MKRTIVLAAALLVASATPAFPQAPDKTTLLLQREASQLGGLTEVVVGKVPTGIPNVPLPDATIIGGVGRTYGTSSNPVHTYDLFYEAGVETLKTYGAALAIGGWAFQPQIGGGFVSSSIPISRVFCKIGAPLVTVRQGTSPDDLRVEISYRSDASDATCERAQPPSTDAFGLMRTSVPNLYVPEGATLQTTSGFSFSPDKGESSARITNGSSADALLDHFTSQMTAAGWRPISKLTGKGIASQTFTNLDDQKSRLQSVILVYAINGKPGNFVAILDVENM